MFKFIKDLKLIDYYCYFKYLLVYAFSKHNQSAVLVLVGLNISIRQASQTQNNTKESLFSQKIHNFL